MSQNLNSYYKVVQVKQTYELEHYNRWDYSLFQLSTSGRDDRGEEGNVLDRPMNI